MSVNESCNWDEYSCSTKGIILPIINEKTWPDGLRGFLYLAGLLWCFLGVAIIADVFMCAIEKITSKTRVIKVASSSEAGYDELEVKVWNDTVANLTLMALGSSAPEILLSCIEIVGNGFKAGELGPSTIVGSAAFNLLCITGVCILAIESPDIRRIHYIKVFGVTAFFSVFAYVWLILILVVITPDYVDLWEAVITFIFFPILVILAFIADKDYCSKKKKVDDSAVELGFGEYNRLNFLDIKIIVYLIHRIVNYRNSLIYLSLTVIRCVYIKKVEVFFIQKTLCFNAFVLFLTFI